MGDTIEIRDPTGTRDVLVAELFDTAATTGNVLTVQSDKSIKAAPGGGSQPLSDAFQGNLVSINNGGNANVTWDTELGPDTGLLDLTDPANPVVIATGVYLVTALVKATTSMTAGGQFIVELDLGDSTGVAYDPISSPPAGTLPQPAVLVTGTAKITAGDIMLIQIANFDGAQAIDFQLVKANVVKLG